MKCTTLICMLAFSTATIAFADDGNKTSAPKSPSSDSAISETEPEAEKAGVATAVAGTPKIDGEIDDAWGKAKEFKVAKSVPDLLQIEEKDMATATVRLLWDKDHLYALWQVTDKELSDLASDDWGQDSVELFLDRDHKKTSWYAEDDAQYRANFKGVTSGQGSGYDEDDIKVKTKKTDTGYLVEMAVHVDAKYLKSGAKLGIEFQVNDDPGSGERGAVAKWHHTEDNSWENTEVFGTLILK